MKDNKLVDLSRSFAVEIVHLCEEARQARKPSVLLNQLLRCGTSIGANIHEGNYASSRADFINKFQIALKECYETEYWLALLRDSGMLKHEICAARLADCSKIRKLLSASIITAKNNMRE